MGSQQFCLKWNNHQSNLLNVFDQLLQNEAFVDVTLACEGLSLKAHKMVLSACSPYFQTLFLENPCKHPIVILNSVRYSELKAIVDFMYKGEVNVSQEQLSLLLKTAEMLKVKGLAEVTNQTTQSLGMNASEAILSVPSTSPPPSHSRRNGSPPPKRKKTRVNPSSSAANSPQQSSGLTNFISSKNSSSTEQSMKFDQTNDTLESKLCKEELNDVRGDSCMMDLPPKLIMEPATDLIDDQSSMSNITSDMPSYDHSKGETADLSSPPDITSSNIQSIPSTSGMQGANQDSKWMHDCTVKPRPGKKSWTMHELVAAMQEVMSGKMSVLRAAKTYGIPKSSLHDYLTGRTGYRLKRCCTKSKKPLLQLKVEDQETTTTSTT